jgi:SAM-dependent methyltransferase
VSESSGEGTWKGIEGNHWVDHAARYDAMLAPFGEAVLAQADLSSGQKVADIGCGCGATSIAAGLAVGSGGSVQGLDLSEPMLELARSRAAAQDLEQVRFSVADAQRHSFEPGALDAVISRFGVMFFDDPPAAYANMASALRPGGRLAFACWQGIGNNEWLMGPGLAAFEFVGLPDMGGPGGPGPFAMEDPDATRELLKGAGFTDIELVDLSVQAPLGGNSTVDEIVDFLATGGPGRALLSDADEDSARKALAAIRELVAERHNGEQALFGAGAWIVSAVRDS